MESIVLQPGWVPNWRLGSKPNLLACFVFVTLMQFQSKLQPGFPDFQTLLCSCQSIQILMLWTSVVFQCSRLQYSDAPDFSIPMFHNTADIHFLHSRIHVLFHSRIHFLHSGYSHPIPLWNSLSALQIFTSCSISPQKYSPHPLLSFPKPWELFYSLSFYPGLLIVLYLTIRTIVFK